MKRLAGFRPFVKYCVVGVLGTAVDVAVLWFLVDRAGWPILLAATASFVAAVIHNFVWNKLWTFRSRSSNYRKLFIKFLIVALVGLLLTNFLMWVFAHKIGLWYIAAKLWTSGAVLIWNFLANQSWTFRSRRRSWGKGGASGETDWSILVPAYNEFGRIGETLERICDFVDRQGLQAEVLVVDDGSTDATAQVALDLSARWPRIRLVRYEKNRGKGFAVRTGVMNARGSKILFTDADHSTPIEELLRLDAELERSGAEVAIGSRYLQRESVKVRQPLYRIWIGRIGNFLIRTFIVDGVKDSQCGFKLFRRNAARAIFERCKVTRWGFDMEVLAIARMMRYRMVEVPVSWYDSPGSRLRPLQDALRTFWELVVIKFNLLCGRYFLDEEPAE